MLGCGRKLAAFAAAYSLVAGSCAAVAAQAVPAPAPISVATAPANGANPWLTLSAMTTSSTNLSKAATEQSEPVAVGWPPEPSLLVMLATIATTVYVVLKNDDGGGRLGILPLPISPA